MGCDTQDLHHPAVEQIELPAVLHALSDPVRLEIVRSLHECGGERRCGGFDVPVTKSTLTHHFRVLREAGLISQRQDGTARLTRLRLDDVEARFPGVLEPILRAVSPPETISEAAPSGAATHAAAAAR
jgi:DNA-binding transcriptional ArsR family regulator